MKINELALLSNGKQKLFAALNNRFASKTSWLEPEQFHTLVRKAFAAICVQPDVGFLLAFDQDANYDSPNFQWFKDREKQFVYIDRIVINAQSQGQGIGTFLYECLFDLARENGHRTIGCEINIIPENPASLAFHESLGFISVKEVKQNNTDKRVCYFTKTL